MQAAGSGDLVQRMIGAARLDVPTYEEVERDENATGQALLVVVLATVASGIGLSGGDNAGRGFLGGIIAGVLGWVVFGVIAYFVGSTLFATSGTSATIGQLLRTTGFASVPEILLVLGFLPILGGIVWLVASVWSLVASVVAIRQALDFSTGRAIGTAIVAAIGNGILLGIIYAIF